MFHHRLGSGINRQSMAETCTMIDENDEYGAGHGDARIRGFNKRESIILKKMVTRINEDMEMNAMKVMKKLFDSRGIKDECQRTQLLSDLVQKIEEQEVEGINCRMEPVQLQDIVGDKENLKNEEMGGYGQTSYLMYKLVLILTMKIRLG